MAVVVLAAARRRIRLTRLRQFRSAITRTELIGVCHAREYPARLGEQQI